MLQNGQYWGSACRGQQKHHGANSLFFGPVIIYDQGGPEENDNLQEHFSTPTHFLACRRKVTRSTRHRVIIFRCPLLENTIDTILQGKNYKLCWFQDRMKG